MSDFIDAHFSVISVPIPKKKGPSVRYVLRGYVDVWVLWHAERGLWGGADPAERCTLLDERALRAPHSTPCKLSAGHEPHCWR